MLTRPAGIRSMDCFHEGPTHHLKTCPPFRPFRPATTRAGAGTGESSYLRWVHKDKYHPPLPGMRRCKALRVDGSMEEHPHQLPAPGIAGRCHVSSRLERDCRSHMAPVYPCGMQDRDATPPGLRRERGQLIASPVHQQCGIPLSHRRVSGYARHG